MMIFKIMNEQINLNQNGRISLTRSDDSDFDEPIPRTVEQKIDTVSFFG